MTQETIITPIQRATLRAIAKDRIDSLTDAELKCFVNSGSIRER